MALGDAYLAFCLRDPYVVNTFRRLLEWRGSKVVMPGTANLSIHALKQAESRLNSAFLFLM